MINPWAYLLKMNSSTLKSPIFIDSSMFKALVDEQDEFHQKAVISWTRFREDNSQLITSNYILDEIFTLIRKRRGRNTVDNFRKSLAGDLAVKIFRVITADEATAWNWFLNDWSNLSFTDCVSFALMQRLGLKKVATFDKHFFRAGFEVEK